MMDALGINIKFSERIISWASIDILMKQDGIYRDCKALQQIYMAATAKGDPLIKQQELRQDKILDTDYNKVDVDGLVDNMKHILINLRKKLKRTLKKVPHLFSGDLGKLKNMDQIHLVLVKGAMLYHAWPFPIPRAYQTTTKKEIQRLCDIRVLSKVNSFQWVAPSFIHPKKRGDVCVLTDFRKLNAVIKKKSFPLPKISDMFQQIDKFVSATAINISMGYYHMELDKEPRKICTAVIQDSKYV